MPKAIGGVVLGGVGFLAACGGGGGSGGNPTTSHQTPTLSAPMTHTISGTLTLYDSATAAAGCTGQDGYSDISIGAQVVVTNQSQAVVGTGALVTGSPNTAGTTCMFGFAVPDVPNESYYGVTVTHRGTLQYSLQDMVSNGWMVSVTLGTAPSP